MNIFDITVRWTAGTLAHLTDPLGLSFIAGAGRPRQPAALVHESAPCRGHTIPVRRAAAFRHGGAMAPATLSTNAAAARKRGGGPLRRKLLAQAIAGRHLMPAGGDIKSLCCAAAGIFLSKPQARAGVVYPFASVREGAATAASLRSPTAPHAQPVEGYKHPQHAAHQVTGGEA